MTDPDWVSGLMFASITHSVSVDDGVVAASLQSDGGVNVPVVRSYPPPPVGVSGTPSAVGRVR